MRPGTCHSGPRSGIHAANGGGLRPLSGQRGFTLIELLVVLTLIGLIAGTVGPNFFEAAQRMGSKNDEQQIRQQVNGLPLAALHAGESLYINEQGAPFSMPEGWGLIARRPIVYQPNGVCLGGMLELLHDERKQQFLLIPPFCQWPVTNGEDSHG